MDETLEQRLAAVERAMTDGDHDFSALAASGDVAHRLDRVESDLETLDDRVAELEAATQALRGYVGNVRHVNREVERRADAALAAVQSSDAAPSPGLDNRESATTGATAANAPDTDPEASASDSEDCRCPHCGTVQTGTDEQTPPDPSPTGTGRGQRATGTPMDSDGVSDTARHTMEAVTETDGGVPNGGERESPSLLSRVRDRL